ncbi:MAG: hypothetical protein ACE5OZ_18175 [Candidatus Heimdallarchaeota archaeon]
MASIERDVVDNPRIKIEGRVYYRCSRCGQPCEKIDRDLPMLCCRHFPDDNQCRVCSKYPQGLAFLTGFAMH